MAFKQRLLGAAVVVVLGVIFVPMVLDGAGLQRAILTGVVEDQSPKPETRPPAPPVPDLAPPSASEAVPPPEPSIAPVEPVAPTPALTQPQEEPVTPAPEPPPSAPEIAVKPGESAREAWLVQVASVTDRAKAQQLRSRLQGGGFPTAFIETVVMANKQTVYRVRIGPWTDRSAADEIKAKLASQAKIQAIVVKGAEN